MATTTPYTRFFDFGVHGRVGVRFQYGHRFYGRVRYGMEEHKIDNKRDVPLPRYGIYQRYTANGKQKIVRRSFYSPKNPRTVAQQANRTTFADGMTAWAGLTESERTDYNKRAQKYKMHGVNLYLREWMRSH